MKAVALWSTKKNSKFSYAVIPIHGCVLFSQPKKDDQVKVNIFVKGLPDGLHGIHIHEKPVSEVIDLDEANCCDQLGGHFHVGEKWDLNTPNGTRHGKHTGDMCKNIYSELSKTAYTYYDDKISLYRDEDNCVLNRSVVIHEDEDDEGKGLYIEDKKNIESLITGNAGARLACAEIREILDPNF